MTPTNLHEYLHLDEWCAKNHEEVVLRALELLMEVPQSSGEPFYLICRRKDGHVVVARIGVADAQELADNAIKESALMGIYSADLSENPWLLFAVTDAIFDRHSVDEHGLPDIGVTRFIDGSFGDDIQVAASITPIDATLDLLDEDISLN